MSGKRLVLREERDEAHAALNGVSADLYGAALQLGLTTAFAQAIGLHFVIVAFGWTVEALLVFTILRHRRTIARWRDQERERLTLAEAERIGKEGTAS